MSILARPDIERLLANRPPLIENADQTHCLQPASYDLRLGKEYYKEGKIERLGEGEKKNETWLDIPAYALVMVTTYEKVNMPTNLVARFGLRLSLVKRGVILQNEPQIDPGYSGRLACLLYNLSSEPVRITYLDRFATIEFEKTLSKSATLYEGPYARLDKLDQFFKDVDKLPVSALSRLNDEIKSNTERTERFVEVTLLALAVMITLLSVIVLVLFSKG